MTTIQLNDFFASIKTKLDQIKSDLSAIGVGDYAGPGTDLDGDAGAPKDDATIEIQAGTLVGGDGNANTLVGTAYFNVIDAKGGNDTVVGSAGYDLMFGGSGIDAADYSYLNTGTNGVWADLSQGFAVGGENDVDNLHSIENLIGTKNDDVLIGNNANNVFYTGGGDDVVKGGAGIDVVQFGGADTSPAEQAKYIPENYTVTSAVVSGVVVHTFTNTVTGDVTKVIGIQYAQFASAPGTLFSIGDDAGGGTGSVIAVDDEVNLADDDGSVPLMPLSNDQVLGVVLQKLLSFQGNGAPQEVEFDGDYDTLVVQGNYGTLTLHADGTATYTAGPEADALLEGQLAEDVFTYTVAGGDTATITINIAGSNDEPTILVAPGGHEPLTELTFAQDQLAAETALKQTGGSFLVEDLDDAGSLSVQVLSSPAVELTPGGAQPGSFNHLTANLMSIVDEAFDVHADNPNARQIDYVFKIQDQAIDFIGQGDKLTITYQVRVTDGGGDFVDVPVVIEIFGSNDNVQITSTSNPADVVEAQYSATQDVAVSGTISVVDLDLNDELTVTFADGTATLNGGSVPSAVQAQVSALLAGTNLSSPGLTSVGGLATQTLAFTYAANNIGLDFLAENDELVLTFQATVSDGNGTATAPITIRFVGTNDAPVLDDIPDQTIAEDETVGATLAEVQALIDAAVSDDDAGDSHYVIVTGSDGFSYNSSTDGDFSYTPAANFHGTVTFTVTAYDQDGEASNSDTVTLTITPVDDLVDANDTFSGDEDTEITGSVAANASTTSGGLLSYALATDVANGTLVFNGNGSFSYTPDANYNGPDSFTYTVTDAAAGESETHTVTLTVNPVNDAPVLADIPDQTIAEDETVGATLAEVQALIDAAVSDDDAGDSHYVIVTGSDGFSYNSSTDGDFSYTPAANFHGTVTFTVTAYDQDGEASNSDTVTLTITPVDDLVDANDTFSGDEDTEITGSVAANASTTSGGLLSYALATDVANGTLVFNGNGSFSYTPDANYNGPDSFTYTVTDAAAGESETHTVTLTVNPVNDAPVLADIPDQTIAEDETVGATLAEVQALIDAAVSDDDAGDSHYVIVTGSDGFSYNSSTDGDFSYTPAANFHGTVTFTVTAYDQDGEASNSDTVTLTITPVDDLVDANDTFSGDEDTEITGSVAANASTTSGGLLSYALATDVANGTLVFNGNGSFSYTPDANYNGPDSFTYTVTDAAAGESETHTVTLTVNPVNDAPVLADIPDQTIAEDETVGATLAEVQALIDAAVSDDDAGDSHYVIVTGSDGFSYNSSTDGDFSYTPAANFHGTVTFTVTAYDQDGEASNSDTVTLTITPVDDLVDANDTFSGDEDTEITGSVAANASTTSGGLLSYALATDVANGTLVFNGNGSFSYTPDANYNGPDSFTYTVTDAAAGESETHTVTLTVNPVNDAPVLADIPDQTIAEDETVGATLAEVQALIDAAVSDDDAGDSHYVIVTGSDGFSYNSSTDGDFSYTPAANFHGTVTFTVTAYDQDGEASNSDTVTLTITPVDDLVDANDTFSGDEDTEITGSVAANASTTSGGLLSYALATDVANGTLVFNGNGSFSYTPDANYNGPDSFTYTVTDAAAGESETHTVTLTVNPVNDAPEITGGILGGSVFENSDSNPTAQDTAVTGQVDFEDIDTSDTPTASKTGQTITFTPSGGSPTLLPMALNAAAAAIPGAFTFTNAAAGQWAFDASSLNLEALADGDTLTIDYAVEVNDGNGGTATTTVTIVITGTNDAPTINAISGTFDEDDLDDLAAGINLLDEGGASDVDEGDEVSIDVGEGMQGTVTLHLNDEFGGHDFDISLPMQALLSAGLVSLSSDGTFEVDDDFADLLKVVMDSNDTLTVDANFTITDGTVDTLAEISSLVLAGDGGTGDEAMPTYGNGVGEDVPDLLVPTFDQNGVEN